jgi:hypothetical protein
VPILKNRRQATFAISGLSLYRLSLDSGVGLRVLTRFVNKGSDIKASNLDKIGEALGLELVSKKKSRK